MNAKVKRRQRVMRVRDAEKRVTEMKLAVAQRKAAEIDAMAARIDRLETDMFANNEYLDGQALQNKAALQAMLDKARGDLARPRAASHEACRLRSVDHVRASLRSDGALRLFDKALKQAEAERDLRADANRPHVTRKSWGATER